MTLRIVLVDDHPTILLGLESILAVEADLDVVGSERTVHAAVETCLRLRPDVVVLDLSMPGEGGEAVLEWIRQHRPSTRVLVLTSCFDPDRVRAVLALGAAGFMLKECSAEELVQAVRASARGGLPVDPRVTGMMSAPPSPPLSVPLTAREHDVIRLVGLGLPNKQIARRLGIAESTVKAHLSSAFHRIGVTDRTSAALWARAHLPEVAPG